MNEDEHKRLTERERAAKARLVIDNPLWAEAWTELESRLMDGWRLTKTGEAERRELIYLQLRAAATARGYIEEILETGQLAERQLEELYARRSN